MTIKNCLFSYNSAMISVKEMNETAEGGAIHTNIDNLETTEDTILIEDTIFEQNGSPGRGGAVSVFAGRFVVYTFNSMQTY